MKMPKGFQLMGHEWVVRVIPAKDWKDDEAQGICNFSTHEILIRKGAQSVMEHTLWHEWLHAALEAMGSEHYDKETFVDPLAGLLHQIVKSAK